MPSPLEVKMKKRADQVKAAKQLLPRKKGLFLRNKVTGVIFGWSPLLSLEDDMEELSEMPEGMVPTSNQPTSSQGKDKYDYMDESDLRDLTGARQIALGNTKNLDAIRKKLRAHDADTEVLEDEVPDEE